MKVVGRTDTGYLVQITETEIGIIMGYGRYPEYGNRKDEFRKATGRERDNVIPTNTEIQVVAGLDYINKIFDRLKTAKKTAGELRELADMLENPLPPTIMPEKDSNAT